MSFLRFVFLIIMSFATAAVSARAADIFETEKKVAFQQGQFGALYAHCGSESDRAVIGGSLDFWKKETFRGYQGSTEELDQLQHLFDSAADAVIGDTRSCKDWILQANATMHGMERLTSQ